MGRDGSGRFFCWCHEQKHTTLTAITHYHNLDVDRPAQSGHPYTCAAEFYIPCSYGTYVDLSPPFGVRRTRDNVPHVLTTYHFISISFLHPT